MLGSLSLHAALLTLPLGSALKGPRGAIESAGGVIRAFLRPEAPEPAPAPEPVAVDQPKTTPTEIKPAPPTEPAKPPAPPAAPRESTAAIPATFFDPAQLTDKPKPLNEPRLDLLVPLLGRAGVAKLILYVDESGNVDRVEVESATLSPEAVERAKMIFGGLRFSPGRFDGAAVKSRVRITVGAEERGREN